MRLLLSRCGTLTDAVSGSAMSGPALAAEAAKRAGVLARQGVRRGDRVMICHGGAPSFFADLFAVWQLGACAACVNPASTTPELATIRDFIRPAAVLATPDQAAGPLATLSAVSLEGAPSADGPAAPGGVLDDPALILFTSGTTGTPKGVVHTFRSLLARLALNRAHLPAEDMRVTLCPLPTHFGHGLIGNCLTPLLAGHDVVLVKGADVRTAATLGAIIDERRITFMSSVPALWKLALRASKPPAGGTLKRVHVGSAPLSADLWLQMMEWSGTREVVNMYGITETANWIGGASGKEGPPQDGLIGRVWGGEAAVRLDSGEIAATGHGELLVQTPSIMQGYYQLPDLTGAVIRDGWFHTGDIGEVDETGAMRLTGRQKFEINRAGLKVHPEDIDILLERHEDVAECCAFGIPDPVAGEIVGVAVVGRSGANVDPKALTAWCRERLAREKIPEKWFVVPEIPKTDRGKINRNTVAAACLKPRAEAD